MAVGVGGGDWIRVNARDVHLDVRTLSRELQAVLHKKVDSVIKNPEVRLAVGNLYIDAVTPYVPIYEGKPRDDVVPGKLRASGRATPDGRVYWTATSPIRVNPVTGVRSGGYNYARVQYTKRMTHTNPMATDHWTNVVSPGTPAWELFIQAAADEITARL